MSTVDWMEEKIPAKKDDNAKILIIAISAWNCEITYLPYTYNSITIIKGNLIWEQIDKLHAPPSGPFELPHYFFQDFIKSATFLKNFTARLKQMSSNNTIFCAHFPIHGSITKSTVAWIRAGLRVISAPKLSRPRERSSPRQRRRCCENPVI